MHTIWVRWPIAVTCGLAILAAGCGTKHPETPFDKSANPNYESTTAELDQAKQKYIWDTEHATFLIETYFGKPLVSEIHKHRFQKFPSWCRQNFKGWIPTEQTVRIRRQSEVSESRTPSVVDLKPTDSRGISNWLSNAMREFSSIAHASFRVLKIEAPIDGLHSFKTRIRLKVAGKQTSGGRVEHLSEHSVVFSADRFELLKKTLMEEAAISEWKVISTITRRASMQLFREITLETRLHQAPILDNWNLQFQSDSQYRNEIAHYRFQVAVADFNRDGFPDIAVVNDDDRPLLLINDRGRQFVDRTRTMGITKAVRKPGSSVNNLIVWIDFNNDSYPDLIVGDRLFHNESGQRFVDISQRSNFHFPNTPMGATVADYDCDGLLDFYVLNQRPLDKHQISNNEIRPWVGDSESGGENQLWKNEGGGRFRNVSKETNAEGGKRHSFAASWFFYDDDRYPDLYIANDFGKNVLLRNTGKGSFEDVTSLSGTVDFATSMGVATGDLNNDGNPEIYVANMYSKMGRRIIAHVSEKDYPSGIYSQILGSCAGNRLYRHRDSGKPYEEIGEKMGVNQVGWAHGTAMVDLNCDGWLDIYSTAGFSSLDRRKPDG